MQRSGVEFGCGGVHVRVGSHRDIAWDPLAESARRAAIAITAAFAATVPHAVHLVEEILAWAANLLWGISTFARRAKFHRALFGRQGPRFPLEGMLLQTSALALGCRWGKGVRLGAKARPGADRMLIRRILVEARRRHRRRLREQRCRGRHEPGE